MLNVVWLIVVSCIGVCLVHKMNPSNNYKTEPFVCTTFCGEAFQYPRDFIVHKKKEHFDDLKRIISNNYKKEVAETKVTVKLEKPTITVSSYQTKIEISPEALNEAETDASDYETEAETDPLSMNGYTTATSTDAEYFYGRNPDQEGFDFDAECEWTGSEDTTDNSCIIRSNDDDHFELESKSLESSPRLVSASRLRSEHPLVQRKVVNGKIINICRLCKKVCADFYIMRIHLRKHTGEKPYSCSCCSLKFSQKTSLNIHTRQHTGERPCKCPRCGQDFISFSAVHYHRKSNKCVGPSSIKASTTSSSRTAAAIVKKSVVSQLKSKVSIKVTKNPSHVQTPTLPPSVFKRRSRHVLTIRAEHPHVTRKIINGVVVNFCKFCQQQFKSYYVAKKHTLNHEGVERYNCSNCDSSFAQIQGLRKHEKLKHS